MSGHDPASMTSDCMDLRVGECDLTHLEITPCAPR